MPARYKGILLFIWPARHDWLRRYFVFKHATYALCLFSKYLCWLF